MGWGDRLCGFYASQTATEMYGFDPNPAVFETYREQCEAYEKYLSDDYDVTISNSQEELHCIGKKTVHAFNVAAEDVDYSSLPDDIDVMLSSPPYFCREKYAKGSDKVDLQSWYRYKTLDDWMERFMKKVLSESWSRIKIGGFVCINISDVNLRGERYPICDELIDYMVANLNGCEFKGVIGIFFFR